jgi:hypothetical protein
MRLKREKMTFNDELFFRVSDKGGRRRAAQAVQDPETGVWAANLEHLVPARVAGGAGGSEAAAPGDVPGHWGAPGEVH